MTTRRDSALTLRLSRDQHERLREVAAVEDRPIAAVIRSALMDYLEASEAGEDNAVPTDATFAF